MKTVILWKYPLIEIFWHDCWPGKMVFGKGCPPFFIAYKKWFGATMIHLFGLRIRIGKFR